jgi:hypothetical protein
VDWNNDGLQDLLVGDGAGYLHIFLNTNTNAEPRLGGDALIEADGKAINVGGRAAPIADDWNGDVKKDLLVGNFDGDIRVYLNKGTDAAPLFGASYNLKLRNGKDLMIGTRVAPRIFDWDRDGVKDILAGEFEGYIYFLRNAGTNSAPAFDGYEKLLLSTGKPLLYSGEEGGHRARLDVTDWNNDGFYDILAGGTDGKVILFAGSHEPLYLGIKERIERSEIREKIMRRLKRLTGRK